MRLDEDMATRWTPTAEQDEAAHALLLQLTQEGIRSCCWCGKLVKRERDDDPWFHVDDAEERCWPNQDQFAKPDELVLVSAHLLVGKQHGFWTADIEVVPVPGTFTDRNAASRALVEAGQKHHTETGKPVSGGWTYHRLPRQGDPDAPTSRDGRAWLTSWAVFEDILCTFPTPSWRTRK